MTIEEAIKLRIDRFNKLWIKATGHSFEEDPEYCNKEREEVMNKWQPKMDAVLIKYGFSDLNEYNQSLNWIDGGITGGYFENSIEEIENVIKEKPHVPASLYEYDNFVLKEAIKTCKFIKTLSDNWWQDNALGESYYDIEKLLNKQGYETSPDHSGNTFGTMMLWTHVLLTNPEWFQYLHGALAPLVGDKGYHDDRSDVPHD